MFQVGDKVRVAADAKATAFGGVIEVDFGGKEVVGKIIALPDDDGDYQVIEDEGFMWQYVSPQYLSKVEEEESSKSLTVEIEKLYRAAEWRGSMGEHELSQIIKLANELA